MKFVMVLAVALVVGVAGRADAQRVEAGVTLGWTFSDGVSGGPIVAGGQAYERIDPKDSFSWGFNIGALATENVEVGFLFGQQLSSLVADGTAETEIGDMSVNTYHGYVGYNFLEADSPIRPYFTFGMGATNFGSVAYSNAGRVGETQSATQFSTTWGLGVKAFTSPNVGIKFGIQWTPTYIKSDAEGYWCDPYWGCYVISDAQYSNQWTLNGGVAFRF